MSEPVVCSGSCSITLQVESVPLSEDRAADLLDLFYQFILVLVVLWGLKKLINLFSSDHEK